MQVVTITLTAEAADTLAEILKDAVAGTLWERPNDPEQDKRLSAIAMAYLALETAPRRRI